MRGIHLTAAALVAVLFASAPLRASADEAKEAYDGALEDFNASRYVEAAAGFRKAIELKPSWKLYYNIGQSEAAAKRHGLALEAFEAYLSKGGDDIAESRRDEVMKEVERLRKMVGSVEIKAPEGSTVFVDWVSRGTAPLLGKLPVAASVKHTVYAVLGEERTGEVPFKVMGGDTYAVTLELEGDEPLPPTPKEPASEADEAELDETPDAEPAAEDPGKKLRTAGWILVGVGGAALIGSAVTGGMAVGLDDDLSNDCEDGHCDEDRGGDIDKLDALSLTTDVLIGVGAAAAITGAVLVIVGHKKKGSEENVSVAPIINDGFAGASISGRF